MGKERKQDRALGIRSCGIREWRKEEEYHRAENTPYEALDKLFQSYPLSSESKVVDFGMGRGRVLFYFHFHFNIPVHGIEVNELTLDEALENRERYWHRLQKKGVGHKAPITMEYGLAEQYEIQSEDTHFYFFNPFSLAIFSQVLRNIEVAAQRDARERTLILYYPLEEVEQFLQTKIAFRLIKTVSAYPRHGRFGRFSLWQTPLSESSFEESPGEASR